MNYKTRKNSGGDNNTSGAVQKNSKTQKSQSGFSSNKKKPAPGSSKENNDDNDDNNEDDERKNKKRFADNHPDETSSEEEDSQDDDSDDDGSYTEEERGKGLFGSTKIKLYNRIPSKIELNKEYSFEDTKRETIDSFNWKENENFRKKNENKTWGKKRVKVIRQFKCANKKCDAIRLMTEKKAFQKGRFIQSFIYESKHNHKKPKRIKNKDSSDKVKGADTAKNADISVPSTSSVKGKPYENVEAHLPVTVVGGSTANIVDISVPSTSSVNRELSRNFQAILPMIVGDSENQQSFDDVNKEVDPLSQTIEKRTKESNTAIQNLAPRSEDTNASPSNDIISPPELFADDQENSIDSMEKMMKEHDNFGLDENEESMEEDLHVDAGSRMSISDIDSSKNSAKTDVEDLDSQNKSATSNKSEKSPTPTMKVLIKDIKKNSVEMFKFPAGLPKYASTPRKKGLKTNIDFISKKKLTLEDYGFTNQTQTINEPDEDSFSDNNVEKSDRNRAVSKEVISENEEGDISVEENMNNPVFCPNAAINNENIGSGKSGSGSDADISTSYIPLGQRTQDGDGGGDPDDGSDGHDHDTDENADSSGSGSDQKDRDTAKRSNDRNKQIVGLTIYPGEKLLSDEDIEKVRNYSNVLKDSCISEKVKLSIIKDLAASTVNCFAIKIMEKILIDLRKANSGRLSIEANLLIQKWTKYIRFYFDRDGKDIDVSDESNQSISDLISNHDDNLQQMSIDNCTASGNQSIIIENLKFNTVVVKGPSITSSVTVDNIHVDDATVPFQDSSSTNSQNIGYKSIEIPQFKKCRLMPAAPMIQSTREILDYIRDRQIPVIRDDLTPNDGDCFIWAGGNN